MLGHLQTPSSLGGSKALRLWGSWVVPQLWRAEHRAVLVRGAPPSPLPTVLFLPLPSPLFPPSCKSQRRQSLQLSRGPAEQFGVNHTLSQVEGSRGCPLTAGCWLGSALPQALEGDPSHGPLKPPPRTRHMEAAQGHLFLEQLGQTSCAGRGLRLRRQGQERGLLGALFALGEAKSLTKSISRSCALFLKHTIILTMYTWFVFFQSLGILRLAL